MLVIRQRASSVAAAAIAFGIGRQVLDKWIKAGLLRSFRPLGSIRSLVLFDDVEALIRQSAEYKDRFSDDDLALIRATSNETQGRGSPCTEPVEIEGADLDV